VRLQHSDRLRPSYVCSLTDDRIHRVHASIKHTLCYLSLLHLTHLTVRFQSPVIHVNSNGDICSGPVSVLAAMYESAFGPDGQKPRITKYLTPINDLVSVLVCFSEIHMLMKRI
jgi:hypothetical protein